MRVPTPKQYGLPDTFDHWRSPQEEALTKLKLRFRRTDVLAAPTGFGKSAVAVAHALHSGLPTCIVTATKALQNQYLNDFESIGMVDIRGRNNYTCDLRPDYTCQDGYAARCPYKGTVACPASQAEMRAACSNLVVTNYSKWMAARRFGQGMDHFEQVIFDEVDEAPNCLADALQVILHHKEIEQGLKMDFLKGDPATKFEEWKEWSYHARAIAEHATAAALARINETSDPKPAWVKHYHHMRELTKRLSLLCSAKADNWIVEEIEEGFKFDPIRPAQYAESYLLLRVPNIIAVSATVRPKTMYMLGMKKESFTFTEFSSDFEPSRCPIYYIPTMRVDSRAGSLQKLWILFDQLAARRRDRNGLVQTISYQRSEEVRSLSRYGDSMFFNDRNTTLADALEQFRMHYPGAILASPSVEMGHDFKGKQAEWQFLCKIPFDPPSKITKAREEADPEYRGYSAMRRLVQMCGRIMRSKEDRGETFIADDHIVWFKPKFGHLAPNYFHKFFKFTEIAPPPPERL